MKDRLIVTVLIASLLSFGCSSKYASKIGPFSVKQPVMLGKIQNISGMTIVPGKQKHEFHISRHDGRADWAFHTPCCASSPDVLDTQYIYNKYDETEELKKYILASDDLIKIDNVYFTSYSFIIPIALISYVKLNVTTGVQVKVYENNSGKKSEKIKLE
jgi:hypothetical protein